MTRSPTYSHSNGSANGNAPVGKDRDFGRLECSSCGATAEAACNCNVAYLPAGARAAKAVAENPEKSSRAIAADTGIPRKTIDRARGPNGPTEKRVGKDGKSYPATKAVAAKTEAESLIEEGESSFCKAATIIQHQIDQGMTQTQVAKALGKSQQWVSEVLSFSAQDVGPGSAAEIARESVRIEELENAKRRLEMENIGLRSEVAELKAAREHTPELVTVEEEEVKAVCSFCQKPNTDPTITSMIKGSGDNDVAICNECVALCSDITTRKDGGGDSSRTGLDPERIQRLITEWNEVLGDIYEKFDPDQQMWATLVLASELYRARKTFDTYNEFQSWAMELDILGTEYDVPDNWDSMTDEEQQAWNEAHASSGLDLQTLRTLLVIGQDPDPFWHVCSLRKGRPKSLSAVVKKAEAADPLKPIDLVPRKLDAVAEKTGYGRFHADDKPTILAMLAEITGVLRAEEGDTGPR